MGLLWDMYSEIITTPEVAEEFGSELPSWIKIQPVKDKKYLDLLSLQVDEGEASAIALATEFNNVLLLLDDLKARKLAAKLDLKYTGTLGIIHQAKHHGIIKEIKPIIKEILDTNFRISEKIIQELLKINNEDENIT